MRHALLFLAALVVAPAFAHAHWQVTVTDQQTHEVRVFRPPESKRFAIPVKMGPWGCAVLKVTKRHRSEVATTRQLLCILSAGRGGSAGAGTSAARPRNPSLPSLSGKLELVDSPPKGPTRIWVVVLDWK